MTIKLRPYNFDEDFDSVGRFLQENFQEGYKSNNWLQPRWEYMHFHPILDESNLYKIGIWEDSGKIIGVAHYESRLGEAFLQVHPEYAHLKIEMLHYIENNFCSQNFGGRSVRLYIKETDFELETIAKNRGFKKDEKSPDYMSEFVIPDTFPLFNLPRGFTLKSLWDENNLYKINRVLWRGFNHPGEPPAEEIEGRVKMQSAPNFRKDLTIVAEAPDGNFVSFCGMWYEPVNRVAYVEPVATDPDYRRMGLGKAAVLEGIRRCANLGATVAYVGSGKVFYEAIGFRKIFANYPWVKYLDA